MSKFNDAIEERFGQSDPDAQLPGYDFFEGGEDHVSDVCTFPAGYLPPSDDYERAERMASEF